MLGGVKNFSVGICNGAPSTAPSSLCFLSSAEVFFQNGHLKYQNRMILSINDASHEVAVQSDLHVIQRGSYRSPHFY